jgi:hypothetical protein
MSETNGLPLPPEPPDIILYWRWFTGYLSREGKVIREAKGIFGAAALVLIAVSAWLTWRAASSFFEERVVVLEKTIDYQKAQIDDLRNRVQIVSPAPVVGHAQLVPVILKFSDATPESKRPFVNFGYVNASPVPARGTAVKGYMKVFDQLLTAEQEDKIMLDLKAEANDSSPKTSTNELPLGNYLYVTAFNRDQTDDARIQDVKDGKKYLYAFFVGQFTDDNQSKDEKYVLEKCVVFYISMESSGLCHGHSQTYVEKIK